MKTIEQLAREVGLLPHFSRDSVDLLQRFHDLAIAQYREGLLDGVGEAVNVPACTLGACKNKRDVCDPAQHCMNTASYYTADQMAAAVLREREGCAQIAWNYEPDENGPIEAAIRRQR